MTDILVALGLLLTIEGALYALFPKAMKKAMVMMLDMPNENLRVTGFAVAAFGIGMLWLLKRVFV